MFYDVLSYALLLHIDQIFKGNSAYDPLNSVLRFYMMFSHCSTHCLHAVMDFKLRIVSLF